MTVTIDGKTLKVEGGGIRENLKPVGTFTDRWIDAVYKKEAKIFGAIRSWTLRCYEENVPWTSSVAKHLQEKAQSGDAVSFSVDEGNLHEVSATNVYILEVDIGYPKGSKASSFIRYFTVKLQEAP
ncbi:hypothetical protein B6U79_03850 [Candidatus Bathyarchaeota archaeon ex4484_231]|nr:MAG: hypothetical protein B6U79_03850 [Candidatus Bathyarchaeota archaeon ex4484_231]RJS76234.1 MAG: hypothetical protein CW712_02370 [Candidatus Bathyarchaeota archaeon]